MLVHLHALRAGAPPPTSPDLGQDLGPGQPEPVELASANHPALLQSNPGNSLPAHSAMHDAVLPHRCRVRRLEASDQPNGTPCGQPPTSTGLRPADPGLLASG